MDSTKRFSDRVGYYVRYRPSYPPQVMDFFRDRLGLRSDMAVADLGSGTGISTCMFLDNGNRVYAVEPNAEMRAAAEDLFAGRGNFDSVDGTAEATTLSDQSVDFIVAAQAFHWFDRTRASRECRRILRPKGWVAILWNERRTDSTSFLRELENLFLEFGNDYRRINHSQIGRPELHEFFQNDLFGQQVFENRQVFDFEGLCGRVYSASYAPLPGAPRHDAMLDRLREIFTLHAVNGTVTIDYDTTVHYGQLQP